MIILQLTGGLGNQMFQYALAKHYQLKGEKVFLETSSYSVVSKNVTPRQFELSVFPITIATVPKVLSKFLNSTDLLYKVLRKLFSKSFNYVFERTLEFDPIYLQVKGNSIIKGYFQSEDYFKDFSLQLRRDFTYRILSSRNSKYEELIRKENSVSMHIRRGDYVSASLTNKIHGLLSLSYYKRAIEIINADQSNPKYFVFTDDPEWARENVPAILDEFTIVDGNLGEGNSWEDMCLISLCKHNILANSSFSWWGAWLNSNPDKKIVAPENWCLDKDLNKQTKNLVPPSWIRVQNNEDITI